MTSPDMTDLKQGKDENHTLVKHKEDDYWLPGATEGQFPPALPYSCPPANSPGSTSYTRQ